MKTWTISPEKEALRRKRISDNHAKYWQGKKRPGLSCKRMGPGNPMYGRKQSEKTKKLMSQQQSGKKSASWRGGLPNCLECDKQLSRYDAQYCKAHSGLTRRAEKNYQWLADKVSYRSLHAWVVSRRGQPGTCEHCGTSGLSGRLIHWANKSGDYLRDLNDWIRLCAKCHKAYDKRGN